MKEIDITLLKALAVEPRARMVSLLSERCLCAGALALILKITPGAVSQHLKVLKNSGLVVFERRSYFLHYRIAPGAHAKAREALDALFNDSSRDTGLSRKCRATSSCLKHKGNML
jgi:DNA-binding transcriptional ArsR family regulator